jgi:hypothetical protein
VAVRAALRNHAPAMVIVAVAVAIAVAFAVTVLRHTQPMGLPLDDSYIYLTYAKQFGRGEPFTYFQGGGYSAGSTSVLWPMVLAPFWTLGARGHALVWVSYIACTVFYAASALGVLRVVRRLTGDDMAGVAGALVLLGIAPFAWSALSGMEVAFASTLLVATIALVIDQPATGPPRRSLAVCLAMTSLSRPEATLLVAGVVGLAALARLRQRDARAAAWWLAPLAAPAAWVIANKLVAGNFFPNTGVAKSYFYLPGFDWTYWLDTLWATTGQMLKGLFWADASPLVWPKLVALLWLVGVVRVVIWARAERRYLAGALIAGGPLVLAMAVVASSGLWSFQNYRYVAPMFPLLAIGVGVALARRRGAGPTPRGLRSTLGPILALAAGVAGLLAIAPRGGAIAITLVASAAAFLMLLPVHLARTIALGLALGLFATAARPGLEGDARLFAQGALDTNTQVVAIGRYLHDKLPEARVMFHDAGAIAYYGDGQVHDMLGLVTNHQAGIANHGAGARFEFLEALPVEARPTHFAYYPAWLGSAEFFGEVLLQTPLRPRLKALAKAPLVGGADMQLIEARFDHVGTGERPLTEYRGWHVVDRIDVAHLASERAHGWRGALGRRKTGDPTARWSVVGRDTGDRGLVLDGGRTIRGGPSSPPGERFAFAVDRTEPARLVLRTGGAPSYPWHEALTLPVELVVYDAEDRELARLTLDPPGGPFVEHVIELPAGVTGIRTVASGPYRVFHWFVLQRDQ